MIDTLFDAKYLHDPHAVYARLRAEEPVYRTATPHGVQMWVVSRYEDVRAAMTDPRLSKDFTNNPGVIKANTLPGGDSSGYEATVPHNMLFVDEPDHGRLRRLVTKAFTAKRVTALRPRIEEISAGLLDKVGPEFDLMHDYAVPLPAMVIGELLGVPEDHWPELIKWSNTTIEGAALDPEEVVKAVTDFTGYLAQLCEERRAEPKDDLFSALVQVQDEEGALSQRELVDTAFLLVVAGHETTVHLICNGMLALLRHPDQLAKLRADESLLPGAIEELLRYDGPISTSTLRFATEPVVIGDTEIPQGQLVLVSLLSANRDEERFGAPALDITRPGGQHVAFGHGIHYCLGAPLARAEGVIAFRHLLERFPALELAVPERELAWRPGLLMHGLTGLPVRA
ncbi:cytochrome P450 [Amycolatopsis sp. NPDC059657]|uniref:cytochrome P450 family protein n=1 Tax=Amycolatopsis sp. NPDC059657 TaxID=3346899 RepID=UPI003672E2AF